MGADAGEQRGLEPAAVLIRTLQIQISGPTETFPLPQYALVRDPGIEPDIQRVGDLFIVCCVVAQKLGRVKLKPGIDTLALHPHRHLLHQHLGVGVNLASNVMHEQGDWHAPCALAGNAPVGPLLQHAVNARPAPVGYPLNIFHRVFGGGEQAVTGHADEPLRCGAKNNRRLVAPAVRVAVPERCVTQQHLAFIQRRHNVIVGLENMLASKHWSIGVVNAVASHGVVNLQPVSLTHIKIFQTVGRRGMHTPSACFGGHVLAEHNGHGCLTKRRHHRESFERRALGAPDDLVTLGTEALGTLFRQRFGDQHPTTTKIE